jgi:hypothetical protein
LRKLKDTENPFGFKPDPHSLLLGLELEDEEEPQPETIDLTKSWSNEIHPSAELAFSSQKRACSGFNVTKFLQQTYMIEDLREEFL